MNRRLAFPLVGLAVAALAGGLAVRAPSFAQPAPAAAPAVKNPFTGAAAIEQGRTLYNATCTACHGANGDAGEMGPGLATPGRSYARRTDADVFAAVKNGISGTPMPAHAGRLSDEQIWKISSYVISLRGTAIDAPSPGDAVAGEAIFFGKGQCSTCHLVRGKGSVVGPDLTNLAAVRKTNSIVNALTKPGYRTYGAGGAIPSRLEPLTTYPVVAVTFADGRKVRGVLRNHDSYSLQMIGLDQQFYLLDRRKLKAVVYEDQSLMPADYDKRLSPEEFANLLAYLTRLTAR
jgi:cytochrome c oxidase cbb3-type subunit 3